MPMPWTYRQASREWQAFLEDAKAAAGGVKDFTGKDQGFEEPLSSDIVLDTDSESEEQSLARLREFLEERLAR